MKFISLSKHIFTHQTILAMRLSVILLTIAFLQVSASGNSQTVNFSGKNVPFKQVFKVIEQQTGYVFFYDVALIRQAKPVTIQLKDAALEGALNTIFKDQPLTLQTTVRQELCRKLQ